MAKLYPPYISGTIPAFTGTTLVVPFSMNRTVGKGEVAGFVAKIKTVTGSVVEIASTTEEVKNIDVYLKNGITFDLKAEYNVGQYYKIQIAYVDKTGENGYFSTVGVAKCTIKPKVSISELSSSDFNQHVYDYTLVYDQTNGDTTEKLYSTRFILKEDDNILIDSGDIVHYVNQDDDVNMAFEEYRIGIDLGNNQNYTLEAIVTTQNGMVISTPIYHLGQFKFEKSCLALNKINLMAESNFDKGTVCLTFDTEKSNALINGYFAISRREADSNEWKTLKHIALINLDYKKFLYEDYTIEQGKEYVYSIQQYNTYYLFSDRLLSNVVYADFEDMFLFDGVRQLNVRFNPKMTSFKKTLLEQKVDTIGGKYPFFMKNGNTGYMEFPVSGLISFQMDSMKSFIPNFRDFLLGSRRSTAAQNEVREYTDFDLVAQNIHDERIFKLEVLNWLNNGEPKLLRTPTEGNYLVRLMNISLTPNDTLGRMLHTFSGTAYEIGEPTIESMTSFGMMNPDEKEMPYRDKTFSIDVGNIEPGEEIDNNIFDREVIYVALENFISGTVVSINHKNIIIGMTGNYYFEPPNGIIENLSIVSFPEGAPIKTGMVHYVYNTNKQENFYNSVLDVITEIKLNSIPSKQFPGNETGNLVDIITNNGNNQILFTNFIRFTKKDNLRIGDTDDNEQQVKYDDYEINTIDKEGHHVINIYDRGYFEFNCKSEKFEIESITIGPRVIAEISCLTREYTYDFPNGVDNLNDYKLKYNIKEESLDE